MHESPCNIITCEFMASRYLPAMRAEMVNRLIKTRGISQSQAARKLGITRAAVCQYLSRKRGGSELEITGEMSALIERWALAVIGEEPQITICDVCRCAMKKQ